MKHALEHRGACRQNCLVSPQVTICSVNGEISKYTLIKHAREASEGALSSNTLQCSTTWPYRTGFSTLSLNNRRQKVSKAAKQKRFLGLLTFPELKNNEVKVIKERKSHPKAGKLTTDSSLNDWVVVCQKYNYIMYPTFLHNI